MVRPSIALLACGCVVTPSTAPKDTGTASDTGVPGSTTLPSSGDTGFADACAADVTLLPFLQCVETTAAQGYVVDTGYGVYGYWTSFAGSGTILAVGGSLPPAPEAAPFYEFEACGDEHVHQVRLEDTFGDIWTFGWDAMWTTADASRLRPGEVADFAVELYYWGFGRTLSFELSDAEGPRVFFGGVDPFLPGGAFDPAEWDMTVGYDSADTCRTRDDEFGAAEHYKTSVAWPGGAADLRSGQSADVRLPTRRLEVTVPASFWYEDCLDGCGGSYLTGWETP